MINGKLCIQFALDKRQRKLLDQYAKAEKFSRSEVIRRALIEYGDKALYKVEYQPANSDMVGAVNWHKRLKEAAACAGVSLADIGRAAVAEFLAKRYQQLAAE